MKRIHFYMLYCLVVIVTLLLAFVFKLSFSGSDLITPKDRVSDFEMVDFYSLAAEKADVKHNINDIVIVCIDSCVIDDIPNIIRIVEKHEPAVIGIDLIFDRHYDSIDNEIISSILECNAIVVPCVITKDSSFAPTLFDSMGISTGAINFISRQQYSVVRYFQPAFELNDTLVDIFAMQIVKCIDKTKYEEFSSSPAKLHFVRCHDLEYDSIDAKKILYPEKLCPQDSINLKGKIVLIGTTQSEDDIHLTLGGTPLSGIKIHAAIIDTILNNRDIMIIPTWINYLVAIVLTMLYALIVVLLRKKLSVLGNLCIRIIQVVSLILCLYIGTILFIRFDLYFNLSITLLAIGLVFLSYDIVFGLNDLFTKLKKNIK